MFQWPALDTEKTPGVFLFWFSCREVRGLEEAAGGEGEVHAASAEDCGEDPGAQEAASEAKTRMGHWVRFFFFPPFFLLLLFLFVGTRRRWV